MADQDKERENLDKLASEFVSMVAHQLKSPLNAIKGFAGLLSENHYGELPPKAKEITERVRASAERGLDLVVNLLDWKKIESGEMKYNFENHDISAIISSVVHELEPLASAKGLKIFFNPGHHRFIARVDKLSFHQVIQNLIDNAIKYTPKGEIKIELAKKDDALLISVIDSGRGIAEGEADLIFEKFNRGSIVEEVAKGSGLGLFIVKNIVEAHGGKVWAESDGAGQGSIFSIKLPIQSSN